jgi:hypothetical protein
VNYAKLLNPRFCFDKTVAAFWRLAPELARPERPVAVDPPAVLRDLVVEWPARYGWGPAPRWVEPIRSGLARYVEVRVRELPQLPNTALQLQLLCRGQRLKVIVDYTDRPDVIWPEYLEDCLLYFKMQFRNEGYDDPRIVPGQYVPSAGLDMYHFLPRLRRLRDAEAGREWEVCGRFGPDQQGSIRARALDVLRHQRAFRYRGGGKLVALSRSLCEVARAKVCLDLPGRGPFCHRLVDYLAIGACIVAYPHAARLEPPLEAGRHLVYCRPDFSDLVELCKHYLTHEEERRAMVEASRDYFDRYLHRDCIAAYCLECVLRQFLGSGWGEQWAVHPI